jgi:hypothetical protein
MKIKSFLAVAAFSLIAAPALAEGMGTGTTIGSGVPTGNSVPGATSNAPATGTNGSAVPEVPGRALPAPSSSGVTASLQQKLSKQGYKNVEPYTAGQEAVTGQTKFHATDSEGQNVILTVDTESGTVVNQQPEM